MCNKPLPSGGNTQRPVSTHDAVQRHWSYGNINLMRRSVSLVGKELKREKGVCLKGACFWELTVLRTREGMLLLAL